MMPEFWRNHPKASDVVHERSRVAHTAHSLISWLTFEREQCLLTTFLTGHKWHLAILLGPIDAWSLVQSPKGQSFATQWESCSTFRAFLDTQAPDSEGVLPAYALSLGVTRGIWQYS